MSEPATILRFDVFELDTASGELRRNGDRIKLPPQPFRVLELLVPRRDLNPSDYKMAR
jgi:DNA-binding winged helix-turn-helix (wHTH) protein